MVIFRQLALTAAILGVTACTTQVVKTSEYSGYLGDYSGLQEAESPSGEPVKRWQAPGADLSTYRAIYIKPTVFYPAPQPNEKVDQQALERIARRCDQALARELGRVRPLAKSPGPGVVVLAPAITAVTANKEGMKPYEVVPVALVVGAIGAAAGTRDEDSNLYVETLLTDGATAAPVAKAVRKIRGETLENSKTRITGSTFDKAIDQAAIDARGLFTPSR